jgi:peroxiredoxin
VPLTGIPASLLGVDRLHHSLLCQADRREAHSRVIALGGSWKTYRSDPGTDLAVSEVGLRAIGSGVLGRLRGWSGVDEMMKTRDGAVTAGDLLPDLEFQAADGVSTSLRVRGRFAAVVVLVHDAECDACKRYLAALAAADAQHREWDGHVVALVPMRPEQVAECRTAASLPYSVLPDPERRAWTALGLTGAAVLIADQWGELRYVSPGGAGHSFPTAEEVTEWLRFLAIECPECEGEAL